MELGQCHPLLCQLCLQKFNSKSKLPLLFESGSTYCQQCVNNKRNQSKNILNVLSTDQILTQSGWKNLDLLQYAQYDQGQLIQPATKQQLLSLCQSRLLVLQQHQQTKTILVYWIQKFKEQIKNIKVSIKNQLQSQKIQANNALQLLKSNANKLNEQIKQQRQKSKQIDDDIKQLQNQLKRLQKSKQQKHSQTSIQKVYKEVKKKGLKLDLKYLKQKDLNININEQNEEINKNQCSQVKLSKYFQ